MKPIDAVNQANPRFFEPEGQYWFQVMGLLIVMLIYMLGVTDLIGQNDPFGTDEAVYSLKAREANSSAILPQVWADYRAPGLPAVMRPFLSSDTDETIPRYVVAVFGLLAILATWLIAQRIFGGLAGAFAAFGLVCTPPFLSASAQVWPDVPGTALALSALAVILCSSTRERVSWWALASVPLIYGATMVRFGAPIQIVIYGAIALFIRWEAVKNSVMVTFLAVALTVIGIYLILFVPQILGQEQSPAAAIASLKQMSLANSPSFDAVILDFIMQSAFLIGAPSSLLLVIGLGWAAGDSGAQPSTRIHILVFFSAGLFCALIIAFLTHAEYRYLSPAWPLIWVAAAAGLSRFAQTIRPKSAAFLLLFSAPIVLISILAADSHHNGYKDKAAIRSAAFHVRHLTDEQACVVISSYAPEFAWYSGCRVAIPDPSDGSLDWIPAPKVRPATSYSVMFGADSVFVATVQHGRGQLSPEFYSLNSSLAAQFGAPENGGRDFVQLYKIQPDYSAPIRNDQ